MGSDTDWKVGGGGGGGFEVGAIENLSPIIKYFEKTLLFC